jgi:hypothetical protein
MTRPQIFRRRFRRWRLPALVLVAAAALVAAPLASSAPSSGWTASPDPLDFGTVAVGSSASLNLTITNTGSIPIYGMMGTFRGGPDLNGWIAHFTNCPSASPELQPGQSCDLVLDFAPSKSGRHKSRFLLQNDRGESLSVNVSGVGA